MTLQKKQATAKTALYTMYIMLSKGLGKSYFFINR